MTMQEWRNPGPTPMERRVEDECDGDTVQCLVEDIVADALARHPADSARIAALRAETYGADFARELADIQAGSHPVQQPPC